MGACSAEQFDINIISILADVIIYFKRKAYAKLVEWKKLYSEKYAVLPEGAYVKIGLNQEKPYKTRVGMI